MNFVVMMGRLTKDPDVRRLSDGKSVASYTLAVDRNTETADFFRCVAFGKQAEFAERYLHKGSRTAIIGRLQNHSYEKNGETVRYDEVIIQRQEFADSKKKSKKEDEFEPMEGLDDIFSN